MFTSCIADRKGIVMCKDHREQLALSVASFPSLLVLGFQRHFHIESASRNDFVEGEPEKLLSSV